MNSTQKNSQFTICKVSLFPGNYSPGTITCPRLFTLLFRIGISHVINTKRITYKLCSLMHGIVHGHAPEYLSDMVVPVADLAGRCHLRSAHDGLYDVPRSRTVFGSRAFSSAGPQAWNQLPADIRNTDTYSTFKHNLKTFLFSVAYGL